MTHTMKRRHFLRHVGEGLAACALLGSGFCSRRTLSRLPNFILIFADDLGYGDLSCFGHPTTLTPNLDNMAREGIKLTSFYSTASVCTPSRVALMTGRYPVRTGLYHNLGPSSKGGLPQSEIILPQILKGIGYRTMAIGKWHLGHDKDDYLPTNRGFDSFYGLLYSNDMKPPWVKTDRPLKLYRDSQPIEHPVKQETLTERYTDEAIRFIRSVKDSPFFIYLPHSMPHLPLRTSEKFQGRSRAGLYGDVIETLDWSVGRIQETLRELGLDENTLIVFTSDNGPWLNLPPRMLQDGNESWHVGSPGLLHGSKGSTYEGGFRVPFIAHWPKQIPAGQVSADMACTMDLYTTFIEAAGAQVPQDRIVDGKNILSFLRGEVPSPRKVFFYYSGKQLRAVRRGKWKFRLGYLDRNTRGPDQLFDLDVDPSEQYDVADRYPDIVKDLEKLMAEAPKVK